MEIRIDAPEGLRTVSCGCCTNGCTCHHHQDIRIGRPVKVCAYHAEHGHPHITSRLKPLVAEQDGRYFYVLSAGSEVPGAVDREYDALREAIKLRGGEVDGPSITVPRLGLYGDTMENGQAWRTWFVDVCAAHGFPVSFEGPAHG